MQKQEYVQQIVSKSYERASRDPVFLDKLISDRQAALEEVYEEIPGEDGTERPTLAEKKEVFAKAGTYLQTAPILKRAEMERLVGQLIDDSRTAYLRTIVQSQALFWVGVFLALVTVGVELWGLMTQVAQGSLEEATRISDALGRAAEDSAARIERYCEYRSGDSRVPPAAPPPVPFAPPPGQPS
ncbi:MAG: hypothetical protein P1V51_03040 [Deltaproteobacteria bacterium]|nr:hypothetical protein [Deltaproteobacteria bacterium]